MLKKSTLNKMNNKISRNPAPKHQCQHKMKENVELIIMNEKKITLSPLRNQDWKKS